MKILFISCGSGADQTVGGSLIRTKEISKRIPNSNVLTTTGGKQHFKDIIEIKTPIMDKWNTPTQLWAYILVFFKSIFIKLPKVDIIYLDSDGLWDIFPALWYKIKNPKVTIVSMNHHLVSKGKYLQMFCHFILNYLADYIFVLNTSMGKSIAKRFTKPITLVKNGVDIKFINSIPSQPKLYDICCFGTMRESKGIRDLIPIAEKSEKKVLVIGDTSFKINHPLIQVTGYIKNKEDAIKLIKQSKIFISPSRVEGWGITNMECLACGLWGVVWDLPVYRTILSHGIIKVPIGNYQAFAEAILKLLGQYNPPIMMDKWSWDRIAKKEVEIYENLLCG